MSWLGRHRREHTYEEIGAERHYVSELSSSSSSSSSRTWIRESMPWRTVTQCGALLCMVGLLVASREVSLRGLDLVREEPTGPSDNLRHGLGSSRGSMVGLAAEQGNKSKQILVTNKYQREGAMVQLYPWQHVAEPMRETRLEISSWPVAEGGEEGSNFVWRVQGEVVGIGSAISTSFRHPGQYHCSVTLESTPGTGEPQQGGGVGSQWREREADKSSARAKLGTAFVAVAESGRAESSAAASSGAAEGISRQSPLDTLDFTVMVKYVRREIRSLTDRDRETFFNAVSVMQRVPSAVGQAIYGPKYYSKDYFNRIHLYYGGRPDCDHWHDGAGFVTSHIAFSLMFEQSLQSINPSIALPYWDFTIEGTFYSWYDFRTSPVFSDDWFGSAAPKNELRSISRGRFAYVPYMVNGTEFSDVYNSYGMLRSPWNSDPTPFLTRSDHLMGFRNQREPSGCMKYRDAMMTQNWMSLTVSFNLGAHGEIHELLGGSWSHDLTAYAAKTPSIVQPLVHSYVPFYKMLWRAGYMTCPESCGFDIPWRECACTCSEENFRGLKSWEVLQDAGLLEGGFFYDKDFVLVSNLADEEGNAYKQIPGYTVQETQDIYNEMLSTLCLPARFGTHYTATSANDVTFWVLHPTFDRLWHLRRLEQTENFDDSWVDNNNCYGHNSRDFQPFHDLFLGEEEGQDAHSHIQGLKSYYTNEELYQMLKPDMFHSPYMYDNFEWPHCDAQGIFIHGHDE